MSGTFLSGTFYTVGGPGADEHRLGSTVQKQPSGRKSMRPTSNLHLFRAKCACMDLTLFRSLLAVAEHGAITDAALALGVSQSALSRRIDQLEEALGASLFERVGRG